MTPTPPLAGPPELLDRALRADPARPLLTFYDDATDERTELSVATFANWVAKTANVLQDDLGLGPGATLLARPAAALAGGGLAAVGVDAGAAGRPGCRGGRDRRDRVRRHGADRGRRRRGARSRAARPAPARRRRPAGTTLDFDREVHGHGDRFAPAEQPDPAAPAFTSGDQVLSGADLGAAAQAAPAPPEGGRLLVAGPLTGLAAVLGGLLVPLATGVTAVLCRHLDLNRLPSRIRQEGLVAAVGPDTPGLPAWAPGGSGTPPG